jgi:hypothetical protein
MGPRAESVEAFLDAARAQIAVELTTLNPSTGEPAISHIRAAFARGMHVVTANKGPIAHCLRRPARRSGARRGGLPLRIGGDGWRAGFQSVALHHAGREGAGLRGRAQFHLESGD